jgi:outer membrane protein TolC
MCISPRNDRLSRVRGAAAGALSIALAACMMGPEFREPHAPPVARVERGAPVADAIEAAGGTQRFSADADLPRDWWTLFRSCAIDDAVTDALVASPTLSSAAAALRESDDNLRAGVGVFYPQIDAAASASREKYSPLVSDRTSRR